MDTEFDCNSEAIQSCFIMHWLISMFLNDSLIEFTISNLLENTSVQTVQNIHMFSTRFYTKLTSVPAKITTNFKEMTEAQRNYENVRRWLKNITIFEGRKTLFFPINEEDFHWYLIVIFIPKVSDGFEPYAVVLDSLGGRKDKEVQKLKDFLLEEFASNNNKNTTGITLADIKEMEIIYPNILIQQDGSSCGLHLIYNVKKILNALGEKCLSTIFDDTSSWFNENVDGMRYEIAKLIKRASAKRGKIFFPYLQFFPTAAEDKAIKRSDATSSRKETVVKTKSKEEKIDKQSSGDEQSLKISPAENKETKNTQEEEKVPSEMIKNEIKKLTFKEYLRNIEENEDDYTALWSYGMNNARVTKKRKY